MKLFLFSLLLLLKQVILTNKKQHTSSLHEKSGVYQPESISSKAVNQVQKYRKTQPSSKELIDGILSGNISALSRAITLVESTNVKHLAKANEVINACYSTFI